MKSRRVVDTVLLFGAVGIAFCLFVAPASAALPTGELLADPGFEDPLPLGTDPWRKVFFTLNPAATDATVMPNNGVEHAELTRDQTANPGAVEPIIESFIFPGVSGAPSALEGLRLNASVDYKVAANTAFDSGGTIPGTFVRMYTTYYGASGFLGFGTFTDIFEAGTNASYLNMASTEVVPTLSEAITSASISLSILGQFGGIGSSTVYFDDASMKLVPEPAAISMLGLGLTTLLLHRKRR